MESERLTERQSLTALIAAILLAGGISQRAQRIQDYGLSVAILEQDKRIAVMEAQSLLTMVCE